MPPVTRHSWGAKPAAPSTPNQPDAAKIASDLSCMETLMAQYRAAQFFAHNAHLLARGPNFMEDHEHFQDLYEAYTSGFDSVAERCIGTGGKPGLKTVLRTAVDNVPEVESNDASFETLLKMEQSVQEQLKTCDESASLGTSDLMQQLAGESETRCYKIRQRLSQTA